MAFRVFLGVLAGTAYSLVVGLSQAQCSMDTDCKGARVCEQGTCVSPPAPTDAAPAMASPTPKSLAEPRVIAAPESTTYSEPPLEQERPRSKRNWKRHSRGMMAGGIVMVAVAPVTLLLSFVATLRKDACESRGRYDFDDASPADRDCGRYDPQIYGGVIAGVGLLGGGIPLIIVGGRREPLGGASLSPWATPQGGGLALRLQL